jgi:hypothetical protein
MKKSHFIIFIFSSLCILFLSSCREGIIEPARLLELYVVDTLGMPVTDATVELYFTEDNFSKNTNRLIETLYTDQEGKVQVALDVNIFDYYVNIEKGELNNWYTDTFINLPNLINENKITILINTSFEAKLTGKYKKRWQQTDNIINGNPSFPNCANQLYHDFVRRIDLEKDKRDGQFEKFQSEICLFPGKSEGVNQWIYDIQSNTMTFGLSNFEEVYKVAEFTGETMSLVYTTPNGAFVIERRYKVIE